jgi:hypothetical protein
MLVNTTPEVDQASDATVLQSMLNNSQFQVQVHRG